MIQIDGVWKQYNLGNTVDLTRTFREAIPHRFSNKAKPKESLQSFWALEDINLSISSGKSLGLIGHNGAGKSTLLKVLSRITKPTRGKITHAHTRRQKCVVYTHIYTTLSQNIICN